MQDKITINPFDPDSIDGPLRNWKSGKSVYTNAQRNLYRDLQTSELKRHRS
mgnify:CR=1 FL=1